MPYPYPTFNQAPRTISAPPVSPFVPTDFANCKFWYNVKTDEDITFGTGNKVFNVVNRANAATPIGQPIVVRQPVWIDGVHNGGGVIRFDGVNEFLSTFPGQTTRDHTMFIVIKRNNAVLLNVAMMMGDIGAGGGGYGMEYNGTVAGDMGAIYAGVTFQSTVAGAATNNFQVLAHTYSDIAAGPNLSVHTIDNLDTFISAHTSIPSLPAGGPIFTVGAALSVGVPAAHCDCDIQEIIVYDRTLTEFEYGTVNGYLMGLL